MSTEPFLAFTPDLRRPAPPPLPSPVPGGGHLVCCGLSASRACRSKHTSEALRVNSLGVYTRFPHCPRGPGNEHPHAPGDEEPGGEVRTRPALPQGGGDGAGGLGQSVGQRAAGKSHPQVQAQPEGPPGASSWSLVRAGSEDTARYQGRSLCKGRDVTV